MTEIIFCIIAYVCAGLFILGVACGEEIDEISIAILAVVLRPFALCLVAGVWVHEKLGL